MMKRAATATSRNRKETRRPARIAFRRALPDASGRFPPLTAAAVAVGLAGLAAWAAYAAPSPRDDRATRDWYGALEKSRATPPDYVFGLAWPAIEAACAFAGYRLLARRSGRARNGALALLGFNLANIPGFAKLFFGDHNLKGATASSVSLLLGAWSFVATAWRSDRAAALAGLPLAVWVTFANYLQEEILRRNTPEFRQRAARMAGA